ncbi:MAG: hypothetical protein KDD44_14295, partial [Bdellovibrionales bacterium]|nr:hypothetical protein [Bdellovibrionales bacterium]
MPELPEVETVARQLYPLLCGKRILRIHLRDPLLRKMWNGRLTARTVTSVRRIGKAVVIELVDPPTGNLR